MMRTVLLIAYHFPPAGGLGAAGSQRAVKFARHFPATGWRPVVLTVRESSYESYMAIDTDMLKQVPGDLPVVRTGLLRALAPLLALKGAIRRIFSRKRPSEIVVTSDAAGQVNGQGPPSNDERSSFQRFKDGITELAEIPDEVSGWLLPAFFAGLKTIRREQVDIIFATGRPWTSLVIGACLKAVTGKPLVVDFRDPWMTNPFRIPYSRLKNAAERRLESWVVRSADIVIANTELLRDEFIDRFGESMKGRCIAVLNGYDPDEFAAVVPESIDANERQKFVMAHPGFLYGRRDPRNFLLALSLLLSEGRIDSGSFLCDLIGPVELDYDLGTMVDEIGLAGVVRLRGAVSYQQSLAALAACDAALLLQPGTSTQIPSKLFEYVGFGKRILAIAPADSAVAKLVEQNHLGAVVDPDNVQEIAAAIGSMYLRHKDDAEKIGISDEIRARFDVRRAVGEAGEAMNELVGDQGR